MCMVSAVLDYGSTISPIQIPSHWYPTIIPNNIPNPTYDYEGYKTYAELLRKAAEYDRIMNEPKCHDPKKLEFLKILMVRMDALGDEFQRVSQDIRQLFNEENI